MNRLALWILFIVLVQPSWAAAIELERNDYLKLIAGNYVHGFKEFDTTVTVIDNILSIGIYWDTGSQHEQKALKLRERFLEQVPKLLEPYDWAKGVVVRVSVYSEKRLNGESKNL